MARTRKDGKRSATAARVGKPRPTGTGGIWQVRAYKPTPTSPHGRVVYLHPQTGRKTSAVPTADETIDEVFDQIEKSLDQNVAIGTHTPTTTGTGPAVRRDLDALGQLYIDWLVTLNRSTDYVSNRRSLLNKWISPLIGDVLVRDWSVEHSQRVISSARQAGLSACRVEDLGSTLSGMRRTAHRKRDGGRWLSKDENPLEDVSYGRSANVQGAHRTYVAPRKRPATGRVIGAIESARDLPVWEWMPDIVSYAAFCAPRLSEQLALRAIDVDLETRKFEINGVWRVDHKADVDGDRRDRYRVPIPKNGKRRVAPYLGSQHLGLVRRCAIALGLPEDTSEDEVIAAITAERERRAQLDSDGDWASYAEDPRNEPWLFVDASGVPPTREAFNDAWHVIRDATDWPKHIPYKNLRHHAALWWKSRGFDWELIAEWDGHDVRTLQRYYVIAAEDGTELARGTLDDL